MYHLTAVRVKENISKAIRHAFTTDGWNSLAAESFLTTTCLFIEPQIYKFSLLCQEQSSSQRLIQLKIWQKSRQQHKNGISRTLKVSRTKQRTQRNRVNQLILPQVVFGPVLNLAMNRCLSVSEDNALLGKCRKLVVFNQHALKTNDLHSAEADLEMKQLQVIQDVVMREV